MTFKEKWLEAVGKKNSVLCAGLDPAEFEMGRKNKGLPELANKKQWALDYVESVAPFAAAVKPNIQYWVNYSPGTNDMEALVEIGRAVHDLGMVYIIDAKLADIGSTNDAGVFNHSRKDFDAVTVAPYAGNMEEIGKQAKERGISAITMCLMSNPEYQREKNMLVPITEEETGDYSVGDIPFDGNQHYVKRYKYLANSARKFGLDGIVIGAPSTKNHIKESELESANYYAGPEILVLLPGIGDQGGEAEKIWRYRDPEKVIVNVGRALMLPNGSNSTPEQQAETAKQYRDMLNNLRS